MFECTVDDVDDEDWLPEPVQPWSRYAPDGLVATVLEQRSCAEGGYEQVERIGAWEKIIAWAQAQQLREMASFTARAEATAGADAAQRAAARACGDPVGPEVAFCDGVEQAAAEVALMLRVAPVTAANRVAEAATLLARYPATVDALAAGAITLAKARIIAEQTEQLSDPHAAAVEQRVLGRASGQTPGQLRRSVRRVVLRTDPDAVRRRHVAAVAARGVWMYELPDGMAMVSACLPAPEAVGVHAVLDHYARESDIPGDERTLPARRADALVDLVCGPVGHPSAGTSNAENHHSETGESETRESEASNGGVSSGEACSGGAGSADRARDRRRGPLWRRRVQVQVRVTVPFSSLFGLDERPAELAGYGPITAEQARALAAHGTWRRILTDPATGTGLDYGTTRYRPPADLGDAITTAKPLCGHPGCLRPATASDLDHHTPHHHTGTTTLTGTGPYCRRHHRLKQTPRWHVEHGPDGTVTWTTPTGHTYTHHPTPIAEPILSPDRALSAEPARKSESAEPAQSAPPQV